MMTLIMIPDNSNDDNIDIDDDIMDNHDDIIFHEGPATIGTW